jgi:uncharacterized membrane protein YphA (DoxX/SURF4 family)
MKKLKIFYWIFTGLLLAGVGIGAVFNALSTPESVEYITALGYPAYVVPFVGVAKILGLIAILIPGFPRVKEWAYAGITFDLIAATYSLIASGRPVSEWAGMILFFILIAGSYYFYHRIRKEKELAKI